MDGQFAKQEKSKTIVYMVLWRHGADGSTEVLLQLRQNTGYMDGKYDLSASGHLELEKKESLMQAAIREAQEELGVEIDADNVDFKLLADGNTDGHLKFVFVTSCWEGELRIAEPEKCAALCWFKLAELPIEDMIPDSARFLKMIQDKRTYHHGAF